MFSHGYPCDDFPGEKYHWPTTERPHGILVALYVMGGVFHVRDQFLCCMILHCIMYCPFEVLLYFALNKISTGCNWMVLFVCSCLRLYMMAYFKVLPDDNLMLGVFAFHRVNYSYVIRHFKLCSIFLFTLQAWLLWMYFPRIPSIEHFKACMLKVFHQSFSHLVGTLLATRPQRR